MCLFGSWYGFCIENCIHVYELENGKVNPDDMSARYQSEDMSFQKNPNLTIGCPDCHDQGALYLAFEDIGEVNEWKIDSDTNNYLPEIEALMMEGIN